MAELKRVKLGDSNIQRNEDLNANFSELESRKLDKTANGFATLDADKRVVETANEAVKAKDYDNTGGTIKTAVDDINSDIDKIMNGTSTVGKAVALNPVTPPGVSKYYGIDEFGNIGWHDYTAGTEDPTGMTAVNFTAAEGWSDSGNYKVLSLPHNSKYPAGVFKEISGEHEEVIVGIRRTATNVIITSDSPFSGYLLLA